METKSKHKKKQKKNKKTKKKNNIFNSRGKPNKNILFTLKVEIINITQTCLYSFDPIKPHFYIVKLGFTGVYIIFLISAQNIDCGTR